MNSGRAFDFRTDQPPEKNSHATCAGAGEELAEEVNEADAGDAVR